MSKGLKSFLKLAVAMVCILIALLGGLALYVTCSPRPVVWLLRNQFGDEVEIQNVDNYEEIKNNVTIYKDLVYPSADERNTYDIYLPKNADEDLPTIVWVHGGAFVAGTKDGIENYAVMAGERGVCGCWYGLPMGTGNPISRTGSPGGRMSGCLGKC